MMSVPNTQKTVAFFDVDGTLLKSTIVHCYIWMRSLQLPFFFKHLWLIGFLPKIVYYLILDRISRTRFNQVFYRNYRGLEVAEMKALSTEMFEAYIRPKIFSEAVSQIQEHQEQGTAIVLVTGSLDFVVQPIADYLAVDAVLAPQLREQGGQFTGELTTAPLIGAEKAEAIRDYADRHEVSLEASYAYGDSQSDLPMLECVGNPIVVNPGKSFRQKALKSGWEMHEWL
ncbi:HAD family hydrolase [Candidatus Poribacteria bacterium]|nr:HAD family hydrolase [Candidatus Poribacteria bacterium]MYH83641.1 HAD family hydrolase [Candidatus Poribacteria bacterium]MYK92416.1 HAD family hydrolase [Candidatus Poribacteria bacterium]